MTLIDALVSEIVNFLSPLGEVMDSPVTTDHFLAQIGASGDGAGGEALTEALQNIAALGVLISALAKEKTDPSIGDIVSLFGASKNCFQALDALDKPGGPALHIGGFALDFLDLLTVAYIGNWHPLLREFATLLTLIEPAETQAPAVAIANGSQLVRAPFQIDRLRLDRLPALVKDPVGTLRAYYWNDLQTEADADAIADKLFVRIRNLLEELGVQSRYGIQPGDEAIFGQEAQLIDHALIVYASNQLGGADVDAGISVTLSPAEHGDLGLVIAPFGVLSESASFGLWDIGFQLAADVQAFAIGRNGPTLLAGPGTAALDAKVTATLAAPDTGPAFVYGSPTGSRLEIGGAVLSAEINISANSQGGAASANVSKSAIVISPGDGDGFLQSILPANGLRADFNLGIAWSSTGGLSFSGSAGLDATLPVGISIGGVVTIPTVHLGLKAGDSDLQIELSASVGLSISVVKALLDRVGLETNLTFPGHGGNLGAADLTFSFKPPSGIGLSIDTGGVTGGGLLTVGPAANEYSGVLQLEFNNLSLQAFGLISTQVAGGSGYSLLALMDASFPPVELGLGFTLNGVGGILAVHRTASEDALRAAMKAGKLGTILFPKNAITNGPQILAQLDSLFPTAHGRFLFGPMALIGWGTPTVLTASIAVILELPDPIEIILLGVLQARFPTPDAPLVKINMDAVGVIDFSQDELSLDATLFDSKLISFTLSGDMALRLNWGSNSEFLLSIGGFHPQFTPPSGFPTLKRITIDMPSGVVSKLRLAAYLAVTSNSLQFGAALDVFIGVSGFGLSGHLGFDALLQLSPFHFEADISGSIALTAGGDDLMSVSLDASLTGPAPWNIAGKFKVHIVFFDVHISFSQSWGLNAPSQQVSTVDVGALLKTTLADPRSWNVQLPTGLAALVSTRKIEDSTAVFAHPLARVGVHERVVPLGLAITHVGQATPTGVTQFAITKFQLGTTTVNYDTVQDQFAPAQFFDLSDTDKLSRPSYELHDAGLVMKGTLVTNGKAVPKTTDYETYFIDIPGALRVDEGVPQPFPWGNIIVVMQTGAAAQKAIGRAGNLRYTAPGNPIKVAEPAFALADTSSLTAQTTAPGEGTTYSDVHAQLAGALAASPARRGALQIVAIHELAAA
ncbi:MAG TPA: DUF6603 domain-containing protein [Acidobacteriaceae bacterium]|jgi:hypothetical protein